MIRKLLRWLVFAPLALLLVLFLFANRNPVSISFDPFSTVAPVLATPPAPLFLWLGLALLVGVALGAAAVWPGAMRAKRQARRARKEIAALTAERDRQPAPVSPLDNLPDA
jgi:uncharacterized integral membrane protein